MSKSIFMWQTSANKLIIYIVPIRYNIDINKLW